MAATTITRDFEAVEKQAAKAVGQAQEKAKKLLSAHVAKIDFAAQEKKLLAELLDLYGIARTATERGVQVDFRPDWRTAALRTVQAKAPRTGGGGKGKKAEAVLAAIKAAGRPLSVEELVKATQMAEKSLRQMVFSLTKSNRLVSMKRSGDGFAAAAKGEGGKRGERGGYYDVGR
ncbi:MAG: hypothetical protein Q8L55_15345 [Phycisphaerales bacterium]|nr:hypothetical protein [Phycisphaerales bacterium]